VTESLQDRAYRVGAEVFGKANMDNPEERANRFFEEACEAVQAVGMSPDRCTDILRYVFNRPRGELSQELGGVMITAMTFAHAFNYDAVTLATVEINRVEANKDRCRAKHAAKPANVITTAVPQS
jgi:NTP pyrophosphatase (non-canonical NTP hydrolase)